MIVLMVPGADINQRYFVNCTGTHINYYYSVNRVASLLFQILIFNFNYQLLRDLKLGSYSWLTVIALLTLIRMTKDEKSLAQRIIALKCLKCQKIQKKYLFLVLEVFFLVNPI
jgi:hypothetical protein